MNCKECRVEIEESGNGGPVNLSARAHIESCADCHAFCDERLLLREMIGSLEVVSAPADFDFRLRARLAGLKSGKGDQFNWGRFSPGAWAMTTVVLFAMVVAIGLIVRQRGVVPVDNSGRAEVANKNSAVNKSEVKPDSEDAALVDAPQGTSASVMTPRAEQAVSVRRRDGFANRDNASRRSTSSATADNDEITSVDATLRSPSTTVLPPGIPDPSILSRTSVAFPIRGSVHPLVIQLDDPRAKAQSISLRRVTFGEQGILENGDHKAGEFSTLQSVW